MEDDDSPQPRKRPEPTKTRWAEADNIVARALRDLGPMSAREIKVALRSYGQPGIKMASINQTLRNNLQGVVECRDGKWVFTGDPDFC